MNILYRFLKRLFDILSSALAIVVFSPLFLISVIGIKVSSPGPVFYKSYRVCKGNKPFTMYKFRTMHVFKPQYEGQRSEGSFVENTRIFKFGNFLRKAKIDELPQLLNILIGQMSVVGPRPVSKERSERTYVGRYASIPNVKPGLACFDSLFDYAHGELVVSDDVEYKEKVIPVRIELAKMYVDHQSIGVDIYCILRTVKLIFQIIVQNKKEFPYTKYEAEAEKTVFGTAV